MRGMIKAVHDWSKGIQDSVRTRGHVSFLKDGVTVQVIEDGDLVHLRCRRGPHGLSETVNLEGKSVEAAGEMLVGRVEDLVRALLAAHEPQSLAEALKGGG